MGRFLNADGLVSTGQGLLGNNMFTYCGNNPILNVDPAGNFFFTALGAATGFIGGAVTTGLMNLVTNSNDDLLSAGINGAKGGAIAGAGVDAALLLVGCFGTALPVVALAGGIAFVGGGIGNAYTTYVASDGTASDEEMSISFVIGGAFNILSLSLSTSAIANNMTGVAIAGMNDFSANMNAGLAIATSTGIATEIGTGVFSTTNSVRTKRMNNCYKSVTEMELLF